jgi:hypothetical protein
MEYGGGIKCEGASPKLSSLVVTGNYNGGISCKHGSHPVISNVRISGNFTWWGISCEYDCNPYLSYVVITGNNGTGIFCGSGADAVLENVSVTNNSGGGVLCYESSPVLKNATIMYNSAEIGGGLHCYGDNCNPYLKHVTIACNAASSCGGGICLEWGAHPVFDMAERCNIYLNSAPGGNDLFSKFQADVQMIRVDTFTVLYPTGFHASPLWNFTFDILNGKLAQMDADLFVSPDGDDNNSGLSAEDPLKTIHYAQSVIMTDTTNPHTVNLMAGTYSRSSNDELFPVVPIDFVYLSGVSPDSVILDAEGSGDVMLCDRCTRTTVSNLSLVNGGGSGMVCQNYCAPRIENMIITGNQSGGIWIERSQPLLINLLIKGNSIYGGVICEWDCSPQLHNVTIVDNESIISSGGGIYC